MSTSAVEITLGTNNAALKSGLAAARGQVEGFKSQTSAMLMGLFSGIGIEQLLEKFGHIQDKAEAFGTTAEAVQRVDQLAQQAGASIDDVAKAMAKLRVNSDGLGKLGINQDEFIHADMDQQLLMVAEALGQIEDPAQRVNMAIEVIGARIAGKLLPLLNMGAEEMKAFFEGTNVVGNRTVAELDAVGDRLTSLKNDLAVAAAYFFGLVSNVMQSIGNGISGATQIAVNGVQRIGEAFYALARGDFKGVGIAMKAAISDGTSTISQSMQNLKDIWSNGLTGIVEKDRKPIIPKGIGIDEHGEGGGAGAKRLSMAERIKALQEEHDRKQLDAAVRLKQLADERAHLEIKLFATSASETERKMALENQLVANKKETLSLEEKAARDQATLNERVAKEKERAEKDAATAAEKAIADKQRAAEKDAATAAKKDKEADQAKMDSLRAQERDLGFVSGVKQIGEMASGQRLAGVDYSVINAEAEKGIKLQEEMRDLLQVMTEKEYKLEIPDAS